MKKGRLDEAIDELKKCIELDPRYVYAHNNLGVALMRKRRLGEAIAEWRKALEIDPKLETARDNLALWEPAAALQDKWPELLEGKFQPRNKREHLALAWWFARNKRNHAAAQLYADAFAAEPKQAEALHPPHRYNAACYAARAAAGQGEDAPKLDDKERARWRKQALDWLRADLTAYGKLLDGGNPEERALARRRLEHRQGDTDLAGIRDAKELAKLAADERLACEKLWNDVAALLKKIEAPK